MTGTIKRSCIFIMLITALAGFLQGCSAIVQTAPGAESTPMFVPPPPVQPTTITTQSPASARPTSQAACTDNLTYRQDLTIPDGAVIPSGSTLDKRWEVENTGTCNWEDGYTLRLIAGDDMGAPAEQSLVPARAGTTAIIRIQFIAPNDPGSYRSAWQAYNPQGQAFGDPIFMEIISGQSDLPTP